MKQVKTKYKHTDPMIFLVGPMGAGKSTIGRLLAEKMKLEFIDIDEEIEKKIGTTISEFFNNMGESEFRKIETTVFKDSLLGSGTVVSTGGGAILPASNRTIMRYGFVIYLHTTPQQQLARISNSKNRPLLANSEQPLKTLSNLMDTRDPLYRSEADLIIRTDNLTKNAIVNELEEWLLAQ